MPVYREPGSNIHHILRDREATGGSKIDYNKLQKFTINYTVVSRGKNIQGG